MKEKIKYLVLAEYPKSPFVVGEIITLSEDWKGELEYIAFDDNDNAIVYSKSDFDSYPQIFKKL